MKRLEDLVGQGMVRRYLEDVLWRARERFSLQVSGGGGWGRVVGVCSDGYRGESLLVLGRSGMGKSSLAGAVALRLAEWAWELRWPVFGDRWVWDSFDDFFVRFDFSSPCFYRYAEVDGWRLRGVEDLDLLLHYVQPMGVIFIDEAHGMRVGVQDMLLRVLECGRWHSGLRGGESYLQSCFIVFATNYEHRLRVALRSRIGHVLFLSDYSEAEMRSLVERELGVWSGVEGLVEEICLRAGGVPRRAVRMARIVAELQCGDLEVLRCYFDSGGFLVGGLDWRMVAVLEALERGGGVLSVADVGAVCGVEREVFVSDVRAGLVRAGCVTFSSRGCRLTERGRELLAMVRGGIAVA